MKKILISILILFSINVFSQTDSSYKTDEIFSISYINYDKKIIRYDDIRLTSLDSVSLSFDEIVYGSTSKENKYKPHTIIYDKIESFRYKDGVSRGEIIRNGAFVGFGLGFVLGCIAGKINLVDGHGSKPTFAESIGTGVLCGFLMAIPTTLLTTLFTFGHNEYETLGISKYNRAKKFEIIKRLIKTGVKENE